MSDTYAAGQVESHGRTVPIFVDDYGRWLATVDNMSLATSARDTLVKKINTLTRRTARKVAVRFTRLEPSASGWRVRYGVAYGIHSGTGNVLVQWDNGVKEQLRPGPNFGPDLKVEQADRWASLAQANAEAAQRLGGFEREIRGGYSWSLKTAVTQALDADDE